MRGYMRSRRIKSHQRGEQPEQRGIDHDCAEYTSLKEPIEPVRNGEPTDERHRVQKRGQEDKIGANAVDEE